MDRLSSLKLRMLTKNKVLLATFAPAWLNNNVVCLFLQYSPSCKHQHIHNDKQEVAEMVLLDLMASSAPSLLAIGRTSIYNSSILDSSQFISVESL